MSPCGSCLTPSPCSIILPVSVGFNPQEDDAKFIEFSKIDEDGSPRAGRRSKTFPEVPHEFRESRGKQESRADHSSGTGNTHGLTGNV